MRPQPAFAGCDIDRSELYAIQPASRGSYLSSYLSSGVSPLLNGSIRHFVRKQAFVYQFGITHRSDTARSLLPGILWVYSVELSV